MFGRRKRKKQQNYVTDPDIFIIEDIVTDNNGIAVVRDNDGNPISQNNLKALDDQRRFVTKNKNASTTNYVAHFSSQDVERFKKKNKKRRLRFFDF